MALSLSSVSTTISCSNQIDPRLLCRNSSSRVKFERKKTMISVKSELKEPSSSPASDVTSQKNQQKLEIGSPIIIIEAPKMLKTAASMPCLRANSDLVKTGDVGRIMSRKPKDVWAVRFTNGTYLIDGKYFKSLKLDLQD